MTTKWKEKKDVFKVNYNLESSQSVQLFLLFIVKDGRRINKKVD